MDKLLFEIPVYTAPIQGMTERFPVNRIFNVGRNYLAHAKDAGVTPEAAPPLVFMKTADNLLAGEPRLEWPDFAVDLHPEVELVVAIGKVGRNLAKEEAENIIFGYAIGFDWAHKEALLQAMKIGEPWAISKVFPGSATISEIVPRQISGTPSGEVRLEVNGEQRISGDLSGMVWPPAAIVAKLSRIWELRPGDLVFTGSPQASRTVLPGDRLRATIGNIPTMLDLELGHPDRPVRHGVLTELAA